MTIGIAVDGAEVAAYACNGTDDEAWFFGNQTDGKIDITSRFRDTLSAEFDGTDVEGDLTMNGVSYEFTAPAVPAPAGMYTAAADGVRASWVVRPDGSAIGVQFNGGVSGRDFEQAELQQLKDEQFRASVRNKRHASAGPADRSAAEQRLRIHHQRQEGGAWSSSTATSGSDDSAEPFGEQTQTRTFGYRIVRVCVCSAA